MKKIEAAILKRLALLTPIFSEIFRLEAKARNACRRRREENTKKRSFVHIIIVEEKLLLASNTYMKKPLLEKYIHAPSSEKLSKKYTHMTSVSSHDWEKAHPLIWGKLRAIWEKERLSHLKSLCLSSREAACLPCAWNKLREREMCEKAASCLSTEKQTQKAGRSLTERLAVTEKYNFWCCTNWQREEEMKAIYEILYTVHYLALCLDTNSSVDLISLIHHLSITVYPTERRSYAV